MFPFEMILVPKENAKISYNVANHGYTMTLARPFYIQKKGFLPN